MLLAVTLRNLQKFKKVQFLYGIWILSSFILTNIFICVFHSKLAILEYFLPIESLDDMYQFITRKKASLLTGEFYLKLIFFNATPENQIFYKLGQYLLENKQFLLPDNTPIIIQTIKSKWPNFVYIDNNSMLNSIVNYIGSNRVYKSSLHLNPDPLAFALPKRSPLLKYFNLFIQQLHEFGIIEKIRSTTFLKESIAHRKNFDNNLLSSHLHCKYFAFVLKIDDLFSIFIFWSIGIWFACIVFCIELTYSSCKICKIIFN